MSDPASAHLAALDYLRDGGTNQILNCGYGHGYSMKEVVNSVETAIERELNKTVIDRRADDPPELIAKVDAIQETLDWKPEFDDLDFIVKTSLNWESKLLERVRTS